MKTATILLAGALAGTLVVSPAMADCQIADAKLEEAILEKPELRGPINRQKVRDLRTLRDAAFTLWSYGRYEDCQRLVANIRELVFAPSMGNLGGNDEEEAEKQIASREPKVQRGAVLGHRHEKGAKPLIGIDELAPGLRADEIIGAEVRSSDDKIVGEVRNVVFGTKDFFLPMPQAEVKTIPPMPDQDYNWLSDDTWRTRNDALFARSSGPAKERQRR